MSSIVNLDMCLIASVGLLPTNILHNVFMDTLKELNGYINDNILVINNCDIGKISLKDRIVVQTYSEYRNVAMKQTELLRETFNRRADIAIKDYRYQLEQEQKRIKESNLALEELNKRIKENENRIIQQEKAIKKQEMSSCEAIVIELKEAAENQGYDIVEEKTDEGVQLQFIRRYY